MDDRIRHIMDSGLLEAYLLGECTEQERFEIDGLLQSSEELKMRFQQLEETQFQFSNTVKKVVPSALKAKIKSQIFEEINNAQIVDTREPVSSQESTRSGSKLNLLLFFTTLLAVVLTVWFYSQMRKSHARLQDIKLENAELKSSVADLERSKQELEDLKYFLNHHATQKLHFNTNTNQQELNVIAYWNKDAEKAMINIAALPQLKTACYQLWADVEGVMLDLGVLKNSSDLKELAFLKNAESLNITIEPLGGSKHPTVANLVGSQQLI